MKRTQGAHYRTSNRTFPNAFSINTFRMSRGRWQQMRIKHSSAVMTRALVESSQA